VFFFFFFFNVLCDVWLVVEFYMGGVWCGGGGGGDIGTSVTVLHPLSFVW